MYKKENIKLIIDKTSVIDVMGIGVKATMQFI